MVVFLAFFKVTVDYYLSFRSCLLGEEDLKIVLLIKGKVKDGMGGTNELSVSLRHASKQSSPVFALKLH